MKLTKDEVNIYDVEVSAFTNKNENDVIVISWTGNIGWGEYTLVRKEGESKWEGFSESMDDNDDKWFLKKLLDQFVDQIEIKE